MFKIIAVVCFLNIQADTNLCFYNAEIGKELNSLENCNRLIDQIVARVDQPFKDKNVAAMFSCEVTPTTESSI
tara:strand:+ start:404 stop:622 length:219 start_codon:yes stop_codon:yes gene_type:complete